MTTAKEYHATFRGRKRTPEQLNELDRLRGLDVAKLTLKSVITIEDLNTLEWGGRFIIANKHLDKCDDAARHALLHDESAGVRAAATLFKPAAHNAPHASAHASVTAAASAIMNGKPVIATLHGLKTAADIEEMIASTHPVSLLERAEAFIAGFEGDEMQEGVDQLLADLRAALKPLR